ncbi:hypothetical protein SAMD00019534_019080, partial [Acytostelium subglobosum LB1]|uniref:hypothetical protein n=1 Tax=Acytostelium subglobosum LB1 TaxID=1410327 RepID=UPI000644A7D1
LYILINMNITKSIIILILGFVSMAYGQCNIANSPFFNGSLVIVTVVQTNLQSGQIRYMQGNMIYSTDLMPALSNLDSMETMFSDRNYCNPSKYVQPFNNSYAATWANFIALRQFSIFPNGQVNFGPTQFNLKTCTNNLWYGEDGKGWSYAIQLSFGDKAVKPPGFICNPVSFPVGFEIGVDATWENNGSKYSQYHVYMKNVGGRIVTGFILKFTTNLRNDGSTPYWGVVSNGKGAYTMPSYMPSLVPNVGYTFGFIAVNTTNPQIAILW